MKAKYFIVRGTVLLILGTFFIFSNCKNQRKQTIYPKHGQQIIDSLDSLFEQLELLNSNSIDYPESAVSTNEKIRKVVEHIRTPKLLKEMLTSYQNKKEHNFGLVDSPDKKVAVVSWQTRLPKPKSKVKNIALYAKGDKIIPTSLYGEPIHYTEIHTIESKKKDTIYILVGKDELSKTSCQFSIYAYSITKAGLEGTYIFPKKQNYLEFEVGTTSLNSLEHHHLMVEQNGMRIILPSITKSTTSYDMLSFNGEKYVSEQIKGPEAVK
ncbi:hypothetical protein [Flagellimonas nanhaiensis]|uniref:Uncharacterized protein n=1 Tax=Flagellimonas nanhaiensis TaxID=2292706 RepID=A0A371JUI6_9FLAO|nr:hypothetical protein [Allomuricauda nanhaiensis]RDY61449.1 hypothetical protein DX873_04615 [Allomuricauda nanhaiensis]